MMSEPHVVPSGLSSLHAGSGVIVRPEGMLVIVRIRTARAPLCPSLRTKKPLIQPCFMLPRKHTDREEIYCTGRSEGSVKKEKEEWKHTFPQEFFFLAQQR